MIGKAAMNKIAQRLLAAAKDGQTEVVVYCVEERLTRYANNVIHQNVAEANTAIAVRTALGKRVGVATTNDVSDGGLARAVEAARGSARLQPEDPDFPGFPEPAAVEAVDAFDEATAAYSPTDRAHDVGVVCRRAEEASCIASGAFCTGVQEIAVANSHGVFAYHPSTIADLTTVVMTGDSAGYSAGAHWQVAQVDVPALGQEAIERALRGRNPQSIAPGVYPVVLEAHAVIDIVAFISQMAGALAVAEGRSWMAGRQGEQLMSPLVSIRDDGRDPAGLPFPFDFEGTPRQAVDIVRDGVVGDAVYDRRWAIKEGKQNTGHALPAAHPASPWISGTTLGPIPMHPAMETGAQTVQEMIAATERGLYVTRFHYTRVVHPREAVITGMTRDGLFLIENGEITTPVKNLRFTQSYVEALRNVEMVGREACRERPFFSIVRAPALKLSAFQFTGATTF
ncbi:MAG: TldD/PmbA family protein [Anaerolineae bacterium]|nr:TldD/PmbA family protein [Anaerolineae bacterium]